MQLYEIEGPDGNIYEVEADSEAAAIEGARQAAGAGAQESDSLFDQNLDRFNILPLAQDKETGDLEFALPSLVTEGIDMAAKAFTAPGRALKGELRLNEEGGVRRGVEESLNMAATFAPTRSLVQGGTKAAQRALTKAPKNKAATDGAVAAAAAQRQGINLPKHMVTDSGMVQRVGTYLQDNPLGGQVLANANKAAREGVEEAVDRGRQGFGSGEKLSAGSRMTEDLVEYGAKTVKDQITDKYDAVDDLVTGNVVTQLDNTRRVAGEILGDRMNAELTGDSTAIARVQKALSNPQGLNYQGIKRLRTDVGKLLDNNISLASDGVDMGEVKQIYGALTDDLRNAVKRSGTDEALKRFDDANAFNARMQDDLTALQKITGKDGTPEKTYANLIAMATGKANKSGDLRTLAKARKAVSQETWDEMASAAVAGMGRGGNPNNPFSVDKFVTEWDSLSKSGRALLFDGGKNRELASALDDIAAVANRMKDIGQTRNTSGSAAAYFTGAGIGGAFVAPLTTLTSIAGTAAVSFHLSRPVTAKQIAAWSKAYEAALLSRSPAAMRQVTDKGEALAVTLGIQDAAALVPRVAAVEETNDEEGN